MGETAQQPAALSTRQPIPGVASLRVNPERIERMSEMVLAGGGVDAIEEAIIDPAPLD
jgi:hypothetical protein